MIRRLKKDVLHDLPSKVRRIVVLRPNKEAEAALRKERELFELNIKVINKAIDKAEASVREDEELAYKEDALGMKLGAIAKDARGKDLPLFEQLSTLRAELAIAKAPLMVTYAKLRLEEHDKIVIFAHHKSLQLALMNGLQQCNIVTILGSDSEDARDLAVYRFQHDPKVRVAICALTLAVGITLTKARYAFLAELDWRPSVNEQAEDRLHRITQEREVLIEHVVLDGSTDALMVKRIIKKMENIEATLD
jgi:SWI/SNF-related matrix-associated actin-dependent regulator 1 of chromatin subfamily A